MPEKDGIVNLYVSHATADVEKWTKAKKKLKISRARMELELITEIDKGDFPIEMKVSWYSAILISSNFDAFWLSISYRFKLPEQCTKRYIPDPTLYEYDVPSEPSSSEADADSPPQVIEDQPTSHSGASTTIGDNIAGAEEEANDYDDLSPTSAAFAAELGSPHTPSHFATEPVPSRRGAFYNLTDLGREDRNDSTWIHAPKGKAGKSYAKTNITPKATATPKVSSAPAKAQVAAPPKRGYAAIAPMRGPAPVAPMQAHVGVAVMTPRGTERPPPAKKVKFNGDGTVMYSKPKATPAFVRKE